MKALGRRRVRRFKSQSAMEYLMTYGWAILIIAVVLGALYSLGVFNSANFAPKAPPGSCHVFRPNGPGTSFDLNLEGVCNGELPEFVASFNGLNPGINISNMNFNLNGYSYTLCAWVDILSYQPNSYGEVLAAPQYANSGLVAARIGSSSYEVGAYLSGYANYFGSASYGTWNFLCAVYAGLGSTLRTDYINANAVGTDTSGNVVNLINVPMRIGNYGYTCCGDTTNPPDYEANVQFYNTTLSTSEIQALYQEGIGGAPIDLQNLVGWWPLNGNANDYSGNGNNGVPSNVMFVSNWYSGYTPP